MARTTATAIAALCCAAACNNPHATAPQTPRFVDDSDPERTRVATMKNPSAPLVVDWQPEYRADLEVRTKSGVGVVRFTEKSLELLPNCRAKGNYDYVGVNPKQQSIVMKSRAELQANVPLGAFDLESKLASHGALSVDLRMVGKRTLDKAVLRRTDLEGECSGATHFVSALTVGAFRFAAGAGNEASGAVAVAGKAGGGGAASASKEMLSTDGDFGACDAASPDDPKAPAKCSAILRIQLVPIDLGQTIGNTAECGGDLRWNGVSCVSPKTAGSTQGSPAPKGYECKSADAAECSAQCDLGNQASCTMLARIKDYNGDAAAAEKLYRGACDADWLEGCGRLAWFLTSKKRFDESRTNAEKACNGGEVNGCSALAFLYHLGWGVPKDRARGYQLSNRACKLKDYGSCTNAGVDINYGAAGVPADPVRARALFELGCDANIPAGCVNLAMMYEVGRGGPKYEARATELKLRACETQKSPAGCILFGYELEEKASGDPNAAKQALAWYERACSIDEVGGCDTSEEARAAHPEWSSEKVDRFACDGGTVQGLGCYNAGFLLESGRTGSKDLAKATTFHQKACKQGMLEKACSHPLPVTSAPPPVAPPAQAGAPAMPPIVIPTGIPNLGGWPTTIPGLPFAKP